MIATTQPTQKANPTIKQELTTTTIVNTYFLEKMFLSFRKGLLCSEPAKEYRGSRNLDFDKLEVGFNSSQFHHGARKDEKLINDALPMGNTNLLTSTSCQKTFTTITNFLKV